MRHLCSIFAIGLVACGGRGQRDPGPRDDPAMAGAGGTTVDDDCAPGFNPELEAEIARVLSLAPGTAPSAEQRSGVQILTATGLKSLTGIWCLPALGTLNLFEASASDLSPLAELPLLVELSIQSSSPPDLASLGRVAARLWKLRVIDSSFSALSDLGRFESLFHLDLSENGLSSLDPMPALPSVEQLYLDQNALEDLTPLLRLTALETLSVRDNALQSLTSLSGHPSLFFLSAGMNQITTLSDLELPGLIGVSVDDNGMTQLGSLRGIPNLLALALDNNPLAGLAGIADAPRLSRVSLSGAPVSDLGELARLESLEELELRRTPVVDLTPLASLTNIRRIDLESSAVVDLSPLRAWENLRGRCRWVGVTDQALTAPSLDVAARLCSAGWDVEPICEGEPCVPHL